MALADGLTLVWNQCLSIFILPSSTTPFPITVTAALEFLAMLGIGYAACRRDQPGYHPSFRLEECIRLCLTDGDSLCCNIFRSAGPSISEPFPTGLVKTALVHPLLKRRDVRD